MSNVTTPRYPVVTLKEPKEPLYPIEDLYGLIPKGLNQIYDMRPIIARIVDGSEFDEFKKLYGPEIVTGFARVNGYPIGILANNDVLRSTSALKAAHFIQLCNQRNIPILFLQNITGYMVGSVAERGGIAKDGAKMVRATANSRVPKYTIIIGGSFGAGNYGMCGRAYSPKFLWMLPSGRISIMGGESAAFVLSSVSGKKGSWSKEEQDSFKKDILKRYDEQGHPYYSSSRLWDDGVIDPKNTRKVLSLALSLSLNEPVQRNTDFGVFRF